MFDIYTSEWEGQRWPIMPMLMPADWERRDIQLGMPLIRGVALPVPILTPMFMLGSPEAGEFRRSYLRQEYLDHYGGTMPELFERAWQNLAARPPTWRELMPDVVTLERDYFATEHGCLPSSLARAADALGTAGPLVVAMPCRTTVFATPLHKVLGSSVHAAALAQTVRRAYQQAGANRICPYLLATNERYVVNTVLEQVT